jgi:hypothetical protein
VDNGGLGLGLRIGEEIVAAAGFFAFTQAVRVAADGLVTDFSLITRSAKLSSYNFLAFGRTVVVFCGQIAALWSYL